eukprot:TRINITY_DN37381_c0_g1_i1.p1 TRINITY_DN37381_c0_g1~~TRINITY_DN37381_c0_g1_i1.p1  ORF type:complete len:423 (-),score=57.76 TRINITY_DN37381_c0_g1_i1:26-1294(-)
MALGRWLFPLATCWLLFINHYARDLPGALEKEIEDGFGVSKAEYGTLNSAYFVPNLVLPLLAGGLSHHIGPLRTVSLVIAVSCIGHLVVGVAASSTSWGLLFFGRVILGCCYEAIDMLPLPLLGSHYKDCWAMLVGVFNGFLRLGSVLNFVVSPWIYKKSGLAAAFWLASLFGLSGLIAVLVMWKMRPKQSAESQGQLPLAEASGEAEAISERSSSSLQVREEGHVLELFRGFPLHFWAFLAAGTFMYAGIVPFWFFGSRYLQENFDESLNSADRLMMLPEGMIAILSPIVGLYVDRGKWSLEKRLRGLALSLICFPVSFALLLVLQVPDLLSVVLLGSGWAFSNCLFWSSSAMVMPEHLLSIGCGVIGTALNLGAATLPAIMGQMTDQHALCLLISVTVMSSFSAGIANRLVAKAHRMDQH